MANGQTTNYKFTTIPESSTGTKFKDFRKIVAGDDANESNIVKIDNALHAIEQAYKSADTTLENTLAGVRSDLANKVERNEALTQKNDCPPDAALSSIPNGFYRCIGNNYPWIPPGAGAWGVLDVRHYSDWVDAIYKTVYGEIYYINQNTADRPYARIALAEPPQVYDLPLASGIVPDGKDRCTYEKDQFGRVSVFGRIKKSGTSDDIENSTEICYLPVGYRPAFDILRNAKIVTGGETIHADIRVFTNGICVIYMPFGGSYKIGQFYVSFDAA